MTNAEKAEYLENIKTISHAASLYYEGVTDSPLTDEEYDDLVESVAQVGDLKGWTEHSPFVTQVAAGVIRGADTGVVRENRMLSLRKIVTHDEVEKFVESLKSDTKLCIEPKLDGFAVSAHYSGGKLVSLTARGDGESGDDITANVLANTNIAHLPTHVDTDKEFEVRGEVYITEKNLVVANEARRNIAVVKHAEMMKKAKTVKEFKEPKRYTLQRSVAAGAVRSKTPVKFIPLTFAIYDVFVEDNSDSYTENIDWASQLGFFPARDVYVPSQSGMSVLEQVEDFSNQRPTLEEPTDGLVLKVDSMSERKAIGEGSRHPYWAVAFKYPTSLKRTVLRSIERAIGRTGAVTYVANFDTVEIEGSNVSQATANNAAFIAALDLHIGDTILVRKAKQIIPEIVSVVESERPEKAEKYVAPTTCPKCGEEMDTTSSLIWRCANPNCSVLENLIYAVSKDHLDVAGLSRERVGFLVEQGLVAKLSDFYKLSAEEIANVKNGRLLKSGDEGTIGTTVAKTIFNGLQAAKKQPLNRVLSSVGVRHLGRTMSREFARSFKNIETILNLSVSDVANYEIKGKKIGESNAERLISDLTKRKSMFLEMKELGFEALNKDISEEATESDVQSTGKLSGKKVLVSGSVPGYTRTTIQEAIEAAGGVNASSVSNTLSFLVADPDSTSSKVVKAKKLGVTIVKPEDFVGML